MPARLDAYRREVAAAGNADVALTQIMNRRILPTGKIFFCRREENHDSQSSNYG